MTKIQREAKMIRLAGHRGYLSKYPENTMLSFRKALEEGVDQIETDVHMTKDGELILMHDLDVDRTTNGHGRVQNLNFEEIRALDAGIKKGPAFSGEQVPTLRELIELVLQDEKTEINIELKDYPYISGEFAYRSCDKVIAMVEEYGIRDRIYLNSFAGDILEYIDRKYPGRYRLHGFYPPFVMNGSFDPETIYDKLFCVCLVNRELDENGQVVRRKDPLYPDAYFRAVKEMGREIWVHLSPETEELVRAVVERGGVTFTADDPHLISEALKKTGLR